MVAILPIVNNVECLKFLSKKVFNYRQQVIVIDSLVDVSTFGDRYSIQIVSSPAEIIQLLPTLQADFLAYIPFRHNFALPDIHLLAANYLAPLVPAVTLPQENAREMPSEALGWIASLNIAKFALPKLESWTILEIARILELAGVSFRWGGVRASDDVRQEKINSTSSIMAIVPHYRCEAWLRRCLQSLVDQTRALDSIVVIDDGSGNPPVSIVKEFSNVTLLASAVNVGPYRLVEQVILDTNYDAYLFQDADDWSTCDRLEKLLQTAAHTGAELIGTQELRVAKGQITPVCYPLDVNTALAEKPGHALIHPSSLATRDLFMRLGGFATGLKFGGDTEFLLRARFAAKIVNIPDYCYFRSKRTGSLTTAIATGLDSPARLQLLKTLKNRALANNTLVKAGQNPCLVPLVKANPIELKYIAGLQWHN
ncbi:glycosyltransferase family 2 protein [Aliterella atlantica]|uniref:Glycosyltransferase 2-like domain-containing protein n=1 Tax=Aliterella atlantica CENA595 TaxID=1618023 RepID=A0A0D8ZX89_9CYAN|nr:glycosyltransferase family 2 protein [Aliterella atlantica]KJH73375.1 hypothetical protein UH38_00920 [Aliterella atlantica CENA595]